jgi:uncharacterized membrane protein
MSSTDPSKIHPEHDEPTPANMDDWSEEQLEQYERAQKRELDRDAKEHRRELVQEEREALDKLRDATSETPAAEQTTTVAFGDAELVVTTKVTGELEGLFDDIVDEQRKEVSRPGTIKKTLIDAILLLIVDDDEPDDDPVTFQSRALWEQYYLSEGSAGLMEAFDTLAEPALERYEELGNSHERTRQ